MFLSWNGYSTLIVCFVGRRSSSWNLVRISILTSCRNGSPTTSSTYSTLKKGYLHRYHSLYKTNTFQYTFLESIFFDTVSDLINPWVQPMHPLMCPALWVTLPHACAPTLHGVHVVHRYRDMRALLREVLEAGAPVMEPRSLSLGTARPSAKATPQVGTTLDSHCMGPCLTLHVKPV